MVELEWESEAEQYGCTNCGWTGENAIVIDRVETACPICVTQRWLVWRG